MSADPVSSAGAPALSLEAIATIAGVSLERAAEVLRLLGARDSNGSRPVAGRPKAMFAPGDIQRFLEEYGPPVPHYQPKLPQGWWPATQLVERLTRAGLPHGRVQALYANYAQPPPDEYVMADEYGLWVGYRPDIFEWYVRELVAADVRTNWAVYVTLQRFAAQTNLTVPAARDLADVLGREARLRGATGDQKFTIMLPVRLTATVKKNCR